MPDEEATPCESCGHVPNTPLVAVDHEAAARTRSADQRATALTAVGSLAASLALAGAGIVVDTTKLVGPDWGRQLFEWGLVLAVGLFTAAAILAVTGHQMKNDDTLVKLADAKHARVNLSMWFLSAGMCVVVVMTLITAIARG